MIVLVGTVSLFIATNTVVWRRHTSSGRVGSPAGDTNEFTIITLAMNITFLKKIRDLIYETAQDIMQMYSYGHHSYVYCTSVKYKHYVNSDSTFFYFPYY